MSHAHIRDHVELIAKHEEEFLASRTRAERIGDGIAAFVGSFSFVIAHAFVFTAWILANTLSLPHLPHFDPRPFSLLSTLVGMEAILLVSFVLMRQFRSGRRSEERDHLTLQVLLLAEKELTLLLRMERQLGDEAALAEIANSREARDLSKTVSIETVAKTIRETLPTE
jgi:uncharacterized membrane protein